MNNFTIPKRIHYCWFGGNALPELAQKCIASWRKHCPDYEIIEWNESNFDINSCDYVREAYEARKWAFVSDVVRLYAIVNYGGIYMDTDVEVLKSLDDILMYEAVSGFESRDRVPTGLMACQKGHPFFVELLHDYDNAHFINEDGSLDTTTNVVRITNKCLKYGLKLDDSLQTVQGFTLFPHDYFCPKDALSKELVITDNTYVIHHFDGSWLSEEDKYEGTLRCKYGKIFPKRIVGYVAKFGAVIKYRGFRAAIQEAGKWMQRKKEKK